MGKVKQIQIPESLFYELAKYFMIQDFGTQSEEAFNLCRDGIEAKYALIAQRTLYSKTHDKSISKEEREDARQKYLDSKGIHEDFRWSAEMQEENLEL